MAMIWMNVDKPTRKCTVHLSECRFVKGKKDTPYKGDGILKRDGGWLCFDSIGSAIKHYEREHPHYLLVDCSCP